MALSGISGHNTDGMRYQPSGTSTISKHAVRKAYRKAVNEINTLYTLWALLVKHKMPLLVTGNIILALNIIAPGWFGLIRSVAGIIVK